MNSTTKVADRAQTTKQPDQDHAKRYLPNITFKALFDRYMKAIATGQGGEKAAKGTITAYKTKQRLIYKYLKQEAAEDLKATDFNIQVGRHFFDWCRVSYSHNYSVRVVQTCGIILEYGFLEGIIQINPLRYLKLKKKSIDNFIHLTPEEVQAIEQCAFPASTWLCKARDLFLFQCYTGLAYADLMSVTKESIFENPADNRKYIIKARLKTRNEAFIPLFQKTEDLWQKYKYVLPKIENGAYNYLLKDLMKFAGIEKRVSSHTARKTFTMIKLNYEGYSIEAVSKMAGHSSIKTTETHYAKVNINRISNELTRLGL